MVALILCHVLTRAPIQVKTLGEFRAAIAAAKPGTTILLAPGTYSGGIFLSDVHGKPNLPITIGGADRDAPPLIVDAGTGLQLSKVSHLVIRDLVIQRMANNGLNIDDGGDVARPSHHVTVQRVSVSQLPSGNHDGIKLSGITDFSVQDCSLSRWGGSGIDMVGCHRGVISGCRLFDGGDSGIQAKGGSSDVVIQACVFTNSGQRAVNLGGSTGFEFFRPPLSTLTEKFEAKNLRVEGCTFIKGGAPIAFVGVDGAVVTFNTLYQPGKWAMRILQETAAAGFVACRNGEFSHNLVVFTSTNWGEGGINIGSGTKPESFTYKFNHWYCEDNPEQSTPRLPSKESGGIYGENPNASLGANGLIIVSKTSSAARVGAHAWKRGR